jgi:hypothetical protein
MNRPRVILGAVSRGLCGLALLLSAANPDAPGASRDDVTRAGAFIDRIERDPEYPLGILPDIRRELRAAQMEVAGLRRGCIGLLQQGTPTEKQRSAHFLGRLGDLTAVRPLVGALADPDEGVREAACYALAWLSAKGQTVESVLGRLCRKDPSVAVRVAAAVALGGANDEDAVAAFRLGLQSTDEGLWQVCEDELEKRGKLELPPPGHVYTEISHQRYREMKADRWYWVQRETTKDGIIYLEVVERARCALLYRSWYRTKAVQGEGRASK